MAFKLFKIPQWGPKRLREIHQSIQDAINERTPKESLTISVQQLQDGVRHNLKAENQGAKGVSSGNAGGGGTPFSLYGELNGAAARYPVLLSSPPTPIS